MADGSPDNLVSIAKGQRAERSGFDSRQGQDFFLLATASRPALGPAQPPNKWIPGVPSPDVMWSYTSTPPKSSWRGSELSAETDLPLPYSSETGSFEW
jgi:hypothetical protein